MNKDKKNEMDIVYGIITIILGIIVITNPKAIASIIPFIIGILMIISSSAKIQYSFDLKKRNSELWVSTLVVAIITLVCGVLLIFNPFSGAKALTQIIGGTLILYSLLDLIECISIKTVVNKKALKEGKIIDAEFKEK